MTICIVHSAPPSATQASCTRGDSAGKEIGVIGQPQQHLITNFFMKQPRPLTLTNETTGLHADSGPARRGPILPTLQIQPSQAATAAPLLASQPDKEQWPTHNPVNRPSGEASSTAAPDVQTQTHRHGRRQCHRRLESRLTDRSSGCGSVCSSGCDPVAHPRLHVRLQTGVVLESYSRQAVGSPPEPDPGDHDSTAAGTDVHVHHHDACLCLNHQPYD